MSSPTIHTKYFKWKEFKDELYTHQLLNSSATFNRKSRSKSSCKRLLLRGL